MLFDQYAAMTLLSVLNALVLIVLVLGNTRLDADKKALFCLSAVLLLIAAAAEFFGVRLNGAPVEYRQIHLWLKVFELSISPFLVMTAVAVLGGLRRAVFLLPVAALNTALQIYSGLTGFLYYVDEANLYHHNTFYWLYTAAYAVCGIFFFLECFRFSRQYQNRSSVSLFAILVFLAAGLSIHSLIPTVRADWTALVMADTMFYIYYINLVEQMDSLTGLLDRKSYDFQLLSLPKNTVIVVFDVDQFKCVNDSYGHETGDRCLAAVGRTVKLIYGRYGLCYRIGGDEFCALLIRRRADLPALGTAFCAELDRARAADADLHLPSVSLGYAVYDPAKAGVEETVRAADAMMYLFKKRRREES